LKLLTQPTRASVGVHRYVTLTEFLSSKIDKGTSRASLTFFLFFVFFLAAVKFSAFGRYIIKEALLVDAEKPATRH
jgi:hypothetical protein